MYMCIERAHMRKCSFAQDLNFESTLELRQHSQTQNWYLGVIHIHIKVQLQYKTNSLKPQPYIKYAFIEYFPDFPLGCIPILFT